VSSQDLQRAVQPWGGVLTGPRRPARLERAEPMSKPSELPALDAAPQAEAGIEAGPGAEQSLAEAVSDHHAYLKAYVARRIAAGQDAEDLAQEVYLRALKFARRENKILSWRGIFTRIAADLVVDSRRRRQVRAGDRHVPLDLAPDPGDDGLNSPERILDGRQRLMDVERTLETLDPDARRAFVLVRFHGHSYAEAAAALRSDPVSIGRMIERATLRLAKAAMQDR
jgi:RNA polymerase sigma factor (sigma-70 family)